MALSHRAGRLHNRGAFKPVRHHKRHRNSPQSLRILGICACVFFLSAALASTTVLNKASSSRFIASEVRAAAYSAPRGVSRVPNYTPGARITPIRHAQQHSSSSSQGGMQVSSRLNEVFVKLPKHRLFNAHPTGPEYVPQLELSGIGGGDDDDGINRNFGLNARGRGRGGDDDVGQPRNPLSEFVSKLIENIKYQYLRAFNPDSIGKGGGGKAKKGKKKGKGGRSMYKVDKPVQEGEEPPEPTDKYDERNHFWYRMGWGRGKGLWITSFVIVLGFSAYEAIIAPWEYYMYMFDMGMDSYPRGSQYHDMKYMEGGDKAMDGTYKSFEAAKGTEPRMTEEQRKAYKQRAYPPYPHESMQQYRQRYQKYKRNKRALKLMTRYNVPDKFNRRKRYTHIGQTYSTVKRSALVDTILTDPYWCKVNPRATEVEVHFPTGTYKQRAQPKFIKSKQVKSNWFAEKFVEAVKSWQDTVATARITMERVKRGEWKESFERTYRERTDRMKLSKGEKLEMPTESRILKEKYPEMWDKNGNLVGPIPECEKNPDFYKDPQFDRFLESLKTDVPHGSRPYGATPYRDKNHPVLDPAVY